MSRQSGPGGAGAPHTSEKFVGPGCRHRSEKETERNVLRSGAAQPALPWHRNGLAATTTVRRQTRAHPVGVEIGMGNCVGPLQVVAGTELAEEVEGVVVGIPEHTPGCGGAGGEGVGPPATELGGDEVALVGVQDGLN